MGKNRSSIRLVPGPLINVRHVLYGAGFVLVTKLLKNQGKERKSSPTAGRGGLPPRDRNDERRWGTTVPAGANVPQTAPSMCHALFASRDRGGQPASTCFVGEVRGNHGSLAPPSLEDGFGGEGSHKSSQMLCTSLA